MFVIIFVLATGLTVLSLRFVRPVDYQRVCDDSEDIPCTTGACRIGEQRAGLPLPVLVDDPGGGSPTNGWGILGPEDFWNPLTFALDAVFYGLLLWLAWHIIRVIQVKKKLVRVLAIVFLLALAVGGGLAAGYLSYQPFLSR